MAPEDKRELTPYACVGDGGSRSRTIRDRPRDFPRRAAVAQRPTHPPRAGPQRDSSGRRLRIAHQTLQACGGISVGMR